VLRTGWDEAEAARWSLRTIEAGEQHAAAFALAERDLQVSYWQFEL
jgi:hypothetical protein